MCHEYLDESRRAGRGPVAPAVFATSPSSQSITLTNPATSIGPHASSTDSHSASLVQPSRIKYSASSADTSTVPSSPTFRCRPENV
jgi:hypothetical protein